MQGIMETWDFSVPSPVEIFLHTRFVSFQLRIYFSRISCFSAMIPPRLHANGNSSTVFTSD